ncbi:uncharacterized protein [Amphiura filiformis]|uniref:uncharacterized protein n=1 Tax=Amphiura filiformis TaxID=82378 RepID=UPI003B20DD84
MTERQRVSLQLGINMISFRRNNWITNMVLFLIGILLKDVVAQEASEECTEKLPYCDQLKTAVKSNCNIEIYFSDGIFPLKEKCPVACNNCPGDSIQPTPTQQPPCIPEDDHFVYCNQLIARLSSCERAVWFEDERLTLNEICPKTCNYCPEDN